MIGNDPAALISGQEILVEFWTMALPVVTRKIRVHRFLSHPACSNASAFPKAVA